MLMKSIFIEFYWLVVVNMYTQWVGEQLSHSDSSSGQHECLSAKFINFRSNYWQDILDQSVGLTLLSLKPHHNTTMLGSVTVEWKIKWSSGHFCQFVTTKNVFCDRFYEGVLMFKVLANRSQLGKVLRYIINAFTLFRIHHCKSFSHIYIQDTHSNDNTIHCKIQFGLFELEDQLLPEIFNGT